jgi:TctA family transporter
MGILEGLVSGFAQAISLEVLPFLIVGSVFGMIIGIIPGLSGHFAMAMLIPFLYKMDPAPGIAFLLAAHATVAQGGGLTAILFSTPGTGQNAATLLDGPPMREQGKAGVAVGAAMTSCFLGATFGAVALALLLPVLQQVVLFFGPPEIFVLSFLALTFIAVLGKEDMTRSLIAGLLGLLVSMIGIDNVTNQERFTFGLLELYDGLPLVPVILGLFAVAEMFDLFVKGGSLVDKQHGALSAGQTQKQIFEGIGIAFKKWWLVMRCSAIGTTIGIIPGLGSAPAAFIAYGHAKQTSKSKETFGKGNIEGVIGAEAANDAVEGGALASTVAFGIPGSSSMAILLGGLFILGLETGVDMVTTDVDIVFVMIFTVIFGNFIGTIFGMFLG